MAIIKCHKGSWKPKDKTLAVNKANFPNSSVSISGAIGGSVTSGENWVRGHTGGYTTAYVTTGTFECDGYSKLEITSTNTTWGNKTCGAYICINGTSIGNRWSEVKGSNVTKTYTLNGAKTISIAIACHDPNNQADCWIEISLNSIRFIP